MKNWNYEIAREYADKITETTTRRLTQLFLTKFSLLAFQRIAIPENKEIDLLCVTKIIEKIVSEHSLIQKCLDGENLDAAWEAFADQIQDIS